MEAGVNNKDEQRYPQYPLFKGLQRPLDFMGIQGRYIYWAAGAVGGAIVGFILCYCFIGFVAGLIALLVSLGAGAALIFTKQRKGLHSKKNDKGVFIYARLSSLCLMSVIMLCSCGDKPKDHNIMLSQQSADKVRDSWKDNRKPIEIQLVSDNTQTISDVHSIGIHAEMKDATEEERERLTGVEFVKRTDVYVSSDANALCSDSAVRVSACYPYYKGIGIDSAIVLKAPFSDNLFGTEVCRDIDSTMKVTMKMQSAMAVVSITVMSDDLTDRLDALRIFGETIFSEAEYKPYKGIWQNTTTNGSVMAQDADCMVNNGRFHNFYLIPTEETGVVTVVATVNQKDYAVKTTLPVLRAGSLFQLNLHKTDKELAIGSSWVEPERTMIQNRVCKVDSVKVGHFLRKDGYITEQKDEETVAVVVETDGRHGKAVALQDAEGQFCFSDSRISSGKIFQTTDGKRKDGVINPRKTDNVSEDERIIFKPDMPYGDDVAIGYGDGAKLTLALLQNERGKKIPQSNEDNTPNRKSMLTEVERHTCSYVPSLREMAQIYFYPPQSIDAFQGEYITCSESGEKTCYSIDMDYGIVSSYCSKQYGKANFRLFYLF